jgi:hypothetical protein
VPAPVGGGTGTALVRVNELATGTSEAASDEYVEIVNAGSAPADVGGWKLVYRSAAGTSDVTLATLPPGASLPAGGFLLFGGSGYGGSRTADQTFTAGLAATGGAVGLRDSSGALVDSVGWGTASNALVETAPATAPPATAAPGSSIGRHPDGHDTGDNAADFGAGAPPTPGTSNG